MKRWAVAYINFFDNSIKLEFVEAETWRYALYELLNSLSPESKSFESLDPFSAYGDITYEEARLICCDMEFGFAVKEIV